MNVGDLNASHIGSEVTLFKDGLFAKGILTDLRAYCEFVEDTSIGDVEPHYGTLVVYVALELNFGTMTIDPVAVDVTVEVEGNSG